MSLVQRASPSLPKLFGFAKRSFKSLRFPGEPLDPSSSPILSYGIHVFHAPVSPILFISSRIAVASFSFVFFFFSGTKWGWENRKWVCFLNRMQLGLWPSSRIALLLKVETYSVPVSSCPKTSTSSIPEGTFCFCCLIFFAKFLRFHLQTEINK